MYKRQALHPKFLILVKVLSRCGVTSLWTVIISTPAATYSSNKSSGLVTIRCASKGFLEYGLIDLILVMSVNPGFGGQTFINSSIDKITAVKDLVSSKPINIQVDGGVNNEIAPQVIKAGANVLVAGSAVFSGSDVKSYQQNIALLLSLIHI